MRARSFVWAAFGMDQAAASNDAIVLAVAARHGTQMTDSNRSPLNSLSFLITPRRDGAQAGPERFGQGHNVVVDLRNRVGELVEVLDKILLTPFGHPGADERQPWRRL